MPSDSPAIPVPGTWYRRTIPRETVAGLALTRDYAHRAGVTLQCEPGGMLSRPLQDALQTAWDKDLDLVEVAPTAAPPVCRILDFGKFKYSQSKKSAEAKKHQRIIKVKEIKMRPKIEDHDYDFKKGHVERFLAQGHRVKVTITLRDPRLVHLRRVADREEQGVGRELPHQP